MDWERDEAVAARFDDDYMRLLDEEERSGQHDHDGVNDWYNGDEQAAWEAARDEVVTRWDI